MGNKAFQLLQLCQAQRGLQVRQAVIVTYLVMHELQLVRFRLGGKMLRPLQPVRVVGHHHAARARGDDLIAVEAVSPRHY